MTVFLLIAVSALTLVIGLFLLKSTAKPRPPKGQDGE